MWWMNGDVRWKRSKKYYQKLVTVTHNSGHGNHQEHVNQRDDREQQRRKWKSITTQLLISTL